MNRYNLISLIALLAFVVTLPVYAWLEPGRMQLSQTSLRQQYLEEGAVLYLEYCALCHGPAGEGIGITPALDHPALAEAHPEFLFRTIARASHGTTMAAWHIEEGGVLNDYQIDELVSFIRFADWQQVNQLAAARGFTPPPETAAETGLAFMEHELEDDPHRCAACHEEPEVHIGRFGLNCARCHSATAWTPAVLTRHNFLLNHGQEENLTCESCHAENYYTHSCYTCHDHTPEQMEQVHFKDEGIAEYNNCIECHPTGEPDEARKLMEGQPEHKTTNSLDVYRNTAQQLQHAAAGGY
jgi:mono/diheme cytochrome c family protein